MKTWAQEAQTLEQAMEAVFDKVIEKKGVFYHETPWWAWIRGVNLMREINSLYKIIDQMKEKHSYCKQIIAAHGYDAPMSPDGKWVGSHWYQTLDPS